MDETPNILLFSMPRSGSTWIGKVLDSHPDTIYRHEPDTEVRITGIPTVLHEEDIEDKAFVLNQYVNKIFSIKTAKTCGKTPIFKKSYFHQPHYDIVKSSIYFTKATEKLGIRIPVITPYKFYLNKSYPLIWKSVISLGRLPVLQKIIPNSKIIIILRHPCGQIASVMKGDRTKAFAQKRSISENYSLLKMLTETKLAKREDLNIDRLKELTAIERLAWQWTLINDHALYSVLDNENSLLIKYDEFCYSPYESTEKIFKFINLEWNSQTEKFIKESTKKSKSSYYSIYKNPKYSAQKWKNELTKNQIDKILSVSNKSKSGNLFNT